METQEVATKGLYADEEERALFAWADRVIVPRVEKFHHRRVAVAGISTIGSQESPWPGPLQSIADFFRGLIRRSL